MAEVYDHKELDAQTLAYLRGCREDKGQQAPGVIIIQNQSAHVWALILGLFRFLVLFGLLFLEDSALHLALLQTALLVASTWLVLAFFRVLAFRHSPNYIGHFLLVDASGVWQGQGDRVTFYPIRQITEARSAHSSGNDASNQARIFLTINGTVHTYKVVDPHTADRFVRFLHLLIEHYADPNAESNADSATLTALGAQGLKIVDEQSGQVVSPINAENLLAVPQPQRVGRTSSSVLAYAVIVLAFITLVPILTTINSDRLESNFVSYMKRQPDPARLRGYLKNPNHTRYRDEVKLLLTNFYTQLAESKLTFNPEPFPDKENSVRAIHAKMQQIVRKLGEIEELPLLTLTVTEATEPNVKLPGLDDEASRTAREIVIRDKIVDAVETSLGSNAVMLARPEPNSAAQLELTYTVSVLKNTPIRYEIGCKLTLRTGNDDPQPARLLWAITIPNIQPQNFEIVSVQLSKAIGISSVPNPPAPLQ